MRSFIQTTLIGGALFLIPLSFVVAVVGKAFHILKFLAEPLTRFIPTETIVGIAVVEVLTALIMFACCFAVGLFARSRAGRRAYGRLDALLLHMLPGYAWFKGMTGDISDDEAEHVLKPVLVEFDDQRQLGFEAERTADGLVAVYLPGVPDPRSGSLSYVPSDRVESVEATVQAVSRICKGLGRGSAAVIGG